MAEYSIPIMFDVTSATEAGAVARLVDALVDAELTADSDGGRGGVESWWTIEAGHKQFDGNDNDSGEVVFQTREPEPIKGVDVWVVTYLWVGGNGSLRTEVNVFADEHAARAAADGATDDGLLGAFVARRRVL